MSTLVVYFAGLFGGILLLTGLAPWWIVVPGAVALVWAELKLFSAAHASDGDQKSEEVHHPPRAADAVVPRRVVVPAPVATGHVSRWE